MAQSQYTYSNGKRKTAIARVKLFEGEGKCTINNKDMKEYFTPLQREIALAPLALLEKKKDFDIVAIISGGGKDAQAGALRHGISRALLLVDPDVRSILKREGFLRRDARVKERKKPGLKGARRAPQFSKR
ncbi:MAG: 30S ribosomal protein S9 [Candidatus Peribacteraceae bacterium]|nr:30S ribosomal protein S9 [Candidatus Peribacteraceae bacterium]